MVTYNLNELENGYIHSPLWQR